MSSDSSDSDDNDDDDDETDAKDSTYYSASDGADTGDGGGEITVAGGGSAEWMQFLRPNALSETLSAMAKAKVSLSKKTRKPQVGNK